MSNSTNGLTSHTAVRVGRGSRKTMPAKSVWGECLPSIAEMPYGAGYCYPCDPAPMHQFSFSEGENNFFLFIFQSWLFRFQVLKGTNCLIPRISVACRTGRNYLRLELLGSTMISRC